MKEQLIFKNFKVIITIVVLVLIFGFYPLSSMAQQSIFSKSFFQKKDKDTSKFKDKNAKIKTEKVYTQKALPSERLAKKKFTKFRRFYQNMVSEFNYYFYARTEYETFMKQLKAGYNENFDEDLNFYDYDPNFGATLNIDTIVDDATKGILLHDFRSDLADDFYILLAKTYLYHKNYTDGLEILEFLNYFYAPKNEIGINLPIGSNISTVNGKFTITNHDKKKWYDFAKRKPVRNESLIWQVQMLFAMNRTADAVGLLELLKNDELFPKYLAPFLNEQIAYNFYLNGLYDSAANHLILSLPMLLNKYDLARRKFFIAQLFERAKRYDLATQWFYKCYQKTNQKTIAIYAFLNYIRLSAKFQDKSQDQVLKLLISLSKKNNYANNKDLIYYVLANLYLEQKDTTEAKNYLVKSIKFSFFNINQKQKSSLQLADIALNQKEYVLVKLALDSIQINKLKPKDIVLYNNYINKLPKYIEAYEGTELYEKILAVDSTPQSFEQLIQWLKQKVTQKNKILKLFYEEVVDYENEALTQNLQKIQGASNDDKKSIGFYFNNASNVQKGVKAFNKIWGDIPNADNWAISAIQNTTNPNEAKIAQNDSIKKIIEKPNPNIETLTTQDLKKLLTKDSAAKEKLRNIIINNYIEMADIEAYYWNHIPEAIAIWLKLLSMYPNLTQKEQIYYDLFHFYNAINNSFQASVYYNKLISEFPNGKYSAGLQKSIQEKQSYQATLSQYNTLEKLLESGEPNAVIIAITNLKNKNLDTGNLFVPLNLLLAKAATSIDDDSLAITTLQQILYKKDSALYEPYIQSVLNIFASKYDLETYLQTKVVVRLPNDTPLPKVNLDTLARNIKTVIDSIEAHQAKPKEEYKGPALNISAIKDTFIFVFVFKPNIDQGLIKEFQRSLNIFNKNFNYKIKFKTSLTKSLADIPIITISSIGDSILATKYFKDLKNRFPNTITWFPKDSYTIFIVEQDNLDVIYNVENLKNYFEFFKEKYLFFN